MISKTLLTTAAVGTLLTLADASLRAQPAQNPQYEAERCFGIARAGKNDCAANGHACQGQAKRDQNPREWLFVPAGTCERLVGGRLTEK